MNNEEKILALLEQMNGRLDKLEQGQSRLETKVDGLEEGQAKLDREVAKIAVRQENNIVPDIKLLAEGHGLLVEKINAIDAKVDHIKFRVDDLTTSHSIHDLKIKELSK